MRVLVIDDAARLAAHKLCEFAARPENHYRPGPGVKPPGDDPRFVVHLNTYRCVFTWTVDGANLWRHLSISVPSPDKMPNPLAVEEIAKMFGFKGQLQDWAAHIDRKVNCVVVGQKV